MVNLSTRRHPVCDTVNRQGPASGALRLALSSVVVAAVAVVAACGGTGSDVVATENGGGVEQELGIEDVPADAEQRVVTVDTEPSATAPGLQTKTGDAAQGAAVDPLSGDVSPESLSTGPVLQWSEIDIDLTRPSELTSTGDGRVVIGGTTSTGEPLYEITSDGSHWEALQLPDAVWPQSFDVTGARWVVAGWSEDNLTDLAPTPQLFLSDDEGSNWNEVTLQIDTPDLPPFATASLNVTAVATAGPHVLVLVSSFVNFQFEALLLDRGLIPAGALASSIWFDGDELGVTLHEESSVDDSDPGRSPQGPEAELTFTIDELDLSAEQRSILEGPRRRDGIRVFSGVGPVLVEAAVVDGWRARAIGTDDGFVLLVQTDDGVSLMRSTDGKDWSAREIDPSLIGGWVSNTALEPDGTAWLISADEMGPQLTRWNDGATEAETVLLGQFDGISEFSVGQAGLAATALPSRREQSAGEGSDPGLPIGRVAKDGYELRYGEPEGGITLWDLAADESVYVFGPEVVSGAEQPEGVREVDDGDTFALTFEDPDTGDDLVTFTLEDLEAVFPSQFEPPDTTLPDVWVGWSSDGSSWGWQTVQEAFGLGGSNVHLELAVGGDFVIAIVWEFEDSVQRDAVVESSGSTDVVTESTSSTSPQARWFIARIP